MKAAKEFGITKTMKVAGLLVFINDVHSLGLANAEGLQLADSWYWNQDDDTRKFAKRFFDKIQAHALVAAGRRLLGHHELPEGRAEAVGTTDGDKVLAEMKKMKFNDFYNKGGRSAPTAA
jgi:branched-chain amino acid transport system substrate-binding protein